MNKGKLIAYLLSAGIVVGGAAGFSANVNEDISLSKEKEGLKDECNVAITQMMESPKYDEFIAEERADLIDKYKKREITVEELSELSKEIKSVEYAEQNADKFMTSQQYLKLKYNKSQIDKLEDKLNVNFLQEMGYGFLWAVGMTTGLASILKKDKNSREMGD